MSLKTFHIIFVALSTLLAGGFGLWAIRDYQRYGEFGSVILGAASLLAGAGLVVYGRWVLHKLKGINAL